MGKWTKTDLRQLRQLMTNQGRDTNQIADEIRHLHNCTKLAAYRMAHGWSQPEAVERYIHATGAFIDQPLLSKLEQFPTHSTRAPLAAQLIGLATIYHTTPLQLISAHALERLDPHERNVLIRCNIAFTPPPQPGQAPTERPDSLEIPDAPGARRVRLADHKLEAERQVVTAARNAFRFTSSTEGSNVGPETLDQLRDEIRRLARAYKTQPLTTLLGDLVETQDIAFRLLEGRQRPDQTRELYLLAGVTSGLMAHASHDVGHPHAAMTQARAAYVCADNAGHDGLRAWVRGTQSVVAYWAGWPYEALRYAQLGADAAAQVTSTTAVLLPALEARAHAVLGNREESRAAVERAGTAREQVTPDELDELGGLLTFDRPKQLYYAADATVWLPDEHEAAERKAAQAVDAYEHAEQPERSFTCEALSRGDLAIARVGRGELDGAREALAPVLDVPPARRIRSIVTTVLRVHALLRDQRYHGSAAAREAQEEIEAFCQATATTALPR